MSTVYPKDWPEDRKVTLADLQQHPTVVPLHPASAKALASVSRTPLRWSTPRERPAHLFGILNLRKFILDVGPQALAALDAQSQDLKARQKAVKAERQAVQRIVAAADAKED